MAEQMTKEQAMETMGHTSSQHDLLKFFDGQYRATVKVWRGPGEPMISTGVMTNALVLDGKFLRQVYEGDPMPAPMPAFQGYGFWGYNTVDKQWEGFWIDTMTTMMQVEHGQLNDAQDVWTMRNEMTDPQSGKRIRKRSVITLKDRDHHSLEMFFEMPGMGEFRSMEIQYDRLGE